MGIAGFSVSAIDTTHRFRLRSANDLNLKRASMEDQIRTELEAAVFRRLREHLMEKRTDVQNIDLMNLAGFCRNCLSRWYQEAASERGVELSKEEGRELFYGMPYIEWKARYQTEATDEQRSAFASASLSNDGA